MSSRVYDQMPRPTSASESTETITGAFKASATMRCMSDHSRKEKSAAHHHRIAGGEAREHRHEISRHRLVDLHHPPREAGEPALVAAQLRDDHQLIAQPQQS